MLSNNSAENVLSGNNDTLSEKLLSATANIGINITDCIEICNLLIKQNATLTLENLKYVDDYAQIKEEMATFRKVSVISNLSKQISAKDNEIEILKKKLKKSQSIIASTSGEPVSPVVVSSIDVTALSEKVICGSDIIVNQSHSFKSIIPKSEEDEAEDEAEDDDEAEDEGDEVEFELKIIKKRKYYISNESPPEVFNVSGEDDIGDRIGILIDGHIQLKA